MAQGQPPVSHGSILPESILTRGKLAAARELGRRGSTGCPRPQPAPYGTYAHY